MKVATLVFLILLGLAPVFLVVWILVNVARLSREHGRGRWSVRCLECGHVAPYDGTGLGTRQRYLTTCTGCGKSTWATLEREKGSPWSTGPPSLS